MHSTRWAAATVALAASVALVGCSATSSAPAPTGSTGGSYTQEDVTAATGIHDVTSVFEVPKDLPSDLSLAYINPSLSTPFFKAMSDGQHAAAEFYGVDFHEADLGNFNFADAVNKYEALSVFQPSVVGILTPTGEGLLTAAHADGVLVLPNGLPIDGADAFIGAPEEETGALAGDALAGAVGPLMDGDWSGRNLVFVGLGQANIPTTMTRVNGALDGFTAAGVTPASSEFPDLGKSATVDDGLRVMTDFLTSHPDDVLAVMAMNNEAGIGALQAVQAAGRQDDVRIVTVGADDFGRAAFKSDDGVIVGEVDLNPWAAGWRWVESAIALALGEDFALAAPDRVITRDNVDELYPEN